jgi:spore germination cell wall hydrolase CwlJ-like protein|tara:strand:+ start:286 stop:672 length:387 start_codon:yes stop_codon:yes gene_type:complete
MLAFILALSAVDYDHLARTVQVEAAKGTMDEFCVAVSVLNRVRSPHFPNTVADVVYAPGQYQGFDYHRPAADPAVVSRLKDNSKMLKAYSIIGDRTDFKGQRMLKYRVASEDPMCHNKGNFYHHFWQK